MLQSAYYSFAADRHEVLPGATVAELAGPMR
jgi:hypothetical protein